MLNLVTIIGARPQFIKAAVLSRLIRSERWNNCITETIIHSGQHYDDNMSDVFFRDMKIPQPDIHLNIGSGLHGEMTGNMLIGIERELIRLKPDIVVVYGDTNTTLAGALTAAKLHIPVAHIEAGLRSFFKQMPEEQNRVLTDHLADLLFCPTDVGVQNLANEGITKGVHQVGDIMLDASLFYSQVVKKENGQGKSRLENIPDLDQEFLGSEFILATIHRAENTDDLPKLKGIIDALNELAEKIILPLHPRTRKIMAANGLKFNQNVKVIDPVGYFEMLELEMNCTSIVTDSGGVQKEAYFMKKPCITLRDQTEWVETVDSGWNTIVGTDKNRIIRAVKDARTPDVWPSFYGDGRCGEKILEILKEGKGFPSEERC